MHSITMVKQPAVGAVLIVVFILNVATILPAAEIAVTSPNGGEIWQAGSAQTITWTTSNPAGSVLVELYRYTGGAYQRAYYLGWASASDGQFIGTLPKYECDGSDYAVGLTWYDDNSWVIDYSDAEFSIANSLSLPTINVTSPQAGDVWAAGTTQTVTWTGSAAGNVDVVLTRWYEGQYIQAALLASLPASAGSYTWTVPTTVVDANDSAILLYWRDGEVTSNYYSDGTFHVTGIPPATTPTVVITSPSGGENWPVASTQRITWTSDSTQGSYRIDLYHRYEDGTFEWVAGLGTALLSAGGLDFTVPESADNGTNYMVSLFGGSWEADSNGAFQITGSLTVTSPNGGETWKAGTTETVTWTSTSTTGNVDISLYRFVAGEYVWGADLGTAPVTDGSRSCTIPSDIIDGNIYIIRLCWSNAGTSSEDESDEAFRIRNPADFNQDSLVDSEDMALFNDCATGPMIAYDTLHLPVGCSLQPDNGILPADFDGDIDVDSDDFAAFQRHYTGSTY